jgi:hypothetical protein
MKKILFTLLMLYGVANAQSVGYLRYDSVRMEKVGGNSELILLNGSRDVTNGVLTNIGNGRTAFRPATSGDSLFGYKDTVFAARRYVNQNGFDFNFRNTGKVIIGNDSYTSFNAKLKVHPDNYAQDMAAFGDSTQDWSFAGSADFAIRRHDDVTIANQGSRKENTLLVVRQMDIDSGAFLNGFYAGSRFLHEYRIRGSAKLRSEGNDFAMAAVAQLQIRKAEGFSGYSTIGTQSDNSIIQAVPALEGLLQMRGSTSSANGMRATGWWSAVAADLVKTANDTINNVAMFMTMGLNTGKVNRMVDYYAYLSGVSSNDTGYAFFAPFKSQRNLFQNITVGSDEDGEAAGRLNHPSAMVDFKSTTKGFLPMVMTTTQRDAISSPATGLLIANSDSSGKLDYYNGSAWVGLGASAGSVGGSSTWNGITDPTGVQSLTFGNGEYTEWTNQNDAEVFIGAVNNSLTTGTFLRGTTSSMTSGNIFQASSTSTALASGNELLDLAMSGTNGTSGITATGARISVTNAGTTSTNIGLAVTASGASTNYAIDATGTIRTSTSVDLPSSLTEGIKFAGTTRIADDGTKMRFSGGGGISQFFLSGTHSQIHVFNSGGSSSINLNGTTRALETVSSNLSIQPGATAKTGFGIAEGSINGSARVEIAAGTTTIGPLKFIAGTNLTTPVTGMHEYDGTQYYLTNSTPTRNIAAVISGSTALASGVIPAATTNGYLTASGFTTSNLVATSYTPTLTDVTNSTSASNAGSAYYYRKGNYIIVYGQLDHSATAGSLLTTVDVSLPVASALTAASDIHGTATAVGGTGMAAGHVRADATNDRATIFFYAPTIGSTNLYYHFMYPVQ